MVSESIWILVHSSKPIVSSLAQAWWESALLFGLGTTRLNTCRAQTHAAPQQEQGLHFYACLGLKHIHSHDYCRWLETILVRIQMSLWGPVWHQSRFRDFMYEHWLSARDIGLCRMLGLTIVGLALSLKAKNLCFLLWPIIAQCLDSFSTWCCLKLSEGSWDIRLMWLQRHHLWSGNVHHGLSTKILGPSPKRKQLSSQCYAYEGDWKDSSPSFLPPSAQLSLCQEPGAVLSPRSLSSWEDSCVLGAVHLNIGPWSNPVATFSF